MKKGKTILAESDSLSKITPSSSCVMTSSEENGIDPITVEEIMPFYEHEVFGQEASLIPSLLSNKKKAISLRINQINKILPEMASKWPNVSNLHYYIAYLLCDMNCEELLTSIEKPSFREKVASEVDEKKKYQAPKTRRR